MLHQWFSVHSRMFSSVALQFLQLQTGSILVRLNIVKITQCNSFLLDSAFTERILGLPSENYKGYVEADATQRARLIKSNSFFLIHGLADSSAPYVHGVKLAKSLTDANVLYRYQV